MIVRTYSRRSRPLPDTTTLTLSSDDDLDGERVSLHGGLSSQDSFYTHRLASQDDDPYGLDELDIRSSSQDEPRRGGEATLMEAQECGEMMEHVDEVNFALDGLRSWQPVRVRRASLLSLLNVCAGAQQRRLLRAQGIMKKIIDAVLDLNFDDPPSIIASAALFYVLASDVQDDLLLESPACVQFLIKLLRPPTTDGVKDKAPSIGSRIMLIRPPEMKNGINKKLDSGSTSIMSKVQEILLHCKEIKPLEGDEGTERPELTSKWIGLLTIEKACLSTVSFEDISGSMRKAGGDFKENLRELGGLDAVVNIAVRCYSNTEGAISSQKLSEVLSSENFILFLKCLKIMENATFLSKDNQNHLLELSLKLHKESTLSFVELILQAINFFSGLSLSQRSLSSCHTASLSCPTETVNAGLSLEKSTDECPENSRVLSGSTAGCPGIPLSPSSKNHEAPLKRQRISRSMQISELSAMSGSSDRSTDSSVPVCKGATNGLISEISVNTNAPKVKFAKGSNQWISINAIGSKTGKIGDCNGNLPDDNGQKLNSASFEKSHTGSKGCSATSPDGHFDPFAFDEDELGPSKWEALTTNKEPIQAHGSSGSCQSTCADEHIEDQTPQITVDKAVGEGFDNKSGVSHDELVDRKECHLTNETDPSIVAEDSDILEDCLLTAVKVLMNLTNDNIVGCKQIGSSGGLDAMTSLIMNHFPTFDSTCSQLTNELLLQRHSDTSHLSDKQLKGHELDFLVAILGLLVNLVEKDGNNRSRLVCVRIPTSQIGRLDSNGVHRDVISLLCSIFLINHRETQAAVNSEITPPSNDEAALLQGEREAELMIVEAYAALLLAFLSTESNVVRDSIADCLPNRNLRSLVPVLERFVDFHLSLNMISPETHTTVSEVIESCRMP